MLVAKYAICKTQFYKKLLSKKLKVLVANQNQYFTKLNNMYKVIFIHYLSKPQLKQTQLLSIIQKQAWKKSCL